LADYGGAIYMKFEDKTLSLNDGESPPSDGENDGETDG
jgi:hypothetical protein